MVKVSVSNRTLPSIDFKFFRLNKTVLYYHVKLVLIWKYKIFFIILIIQFTCQSIWYTSLVVMVFSSFLFWAWKGIPVTSPIWQKIAGKFFGIIQVGEQKRRSNGELFGSEFRQKLWKDIMGLIKQPSSFRWTSSGAITASTLFISLSLTLASLAATGAGWPAYAYVGACPPHVTCDLFHATMAREGGWRDFMYHCSPRRWTQLGRRTVHHNQGGW